MRASLVLLAGLSALGALAWVNRDAARGLARRSRQVRQELQRWEGEGGSPVTPGMPSAPTGAASGGPAASGPLPLH